MKASPVAFSRVAIRPELITRAALVRRNTLQLGGLSDYLTGSSSSSSSHNRGPTSSSGSSDPNGLGGGMPLISSGSPSLPSSTLAASPLCSESTNIYTLAYGAAEGLAPGERLEVCGGRLRLLRTMAFGCPRGVTKDSVTKGAIPRAHLDAITEQLDRLKAAYTSMSRSTGSHSSTTKSGGRGGGASALTEEAAVSTLTWELESAVEDAATAASDATLNAELEEMKHSDEEVLVASWVKRSAKSQQQQQQAAVKGEETGCISAQACGTDDLIVENGVCFSCPEHAGLHVLRPARLAFMSSVEYKAKSLAEQRRRRQGEEHRPMAVLDASEMDFSFSHSALQTLVDLGLYSESLCHITFVPLTFKAAETHKDQRDSAGSGAASLVRLVVDEPGIPMRDPFRVLPVSYYDVAAYTAYLELHLPGADGTAGSQQQHRKKKQSVKLFRTGMRRNTTTVQLSQALATLRSGASMLVSLVPTPSSFAAVHTAMMGSEVEVETCTVVQAKTCVAEAIALTGRWGYITDEVLPSVDSPQGSAVSLMVTLK